MNADILNAATLYTTDRKRFMVEMGNTLHQDYLDMLFMNATTRPDLAETVALILGGYTPKTEKHGLDGLPSETQPGYAEVKVYTTNTNKDKHAQFGALTINDPSQNIVDKYNQTQAKFLFPTYIDGHLIAMFSVEWKHLKTIYDTEIARIHARNQNKAAGSAAARNFSLTVSKWITHAKCEFVNPDTDMVRLKLTEVKASKVYKAAVNQAIVDTSSVMV